jgi:hypothetical protein
LDEQTLSDENTEVKTRELSSARLERGVGWHKRHGVPTSSTIVTGPSLTIETCIRSPKTPV